MKLSTGKISVLSTLSALRISNIFFADFLYRENHALGAWFQRAYSFAQKNSFAIVCKTVWQLSTKKAKEFLYDHTYK